MLDLFMFLIFLVGIAAILIVVARDKGWTLPAGLAAVASAVTVWATDVADKVSGWF